jgi:methylaspartate mutase epsilon subunit
MKEMYSILIGSLGDDSHSVGMALLSISFKESGFYVRSIGIMNQLDDFFRDARNVDAIFISCMNGHVDLYLDDFPKRLKQYQIQDSRPQCWYLGGKLSVQDSDEEVIKKYRRMGFDYVSPRPVSIKIVMEKLLMDFYHKGIKKKKLKPQFLEQSELFWISPSDKTDDNPLSDEEFFKLREEVLSSWPTGKEVWDADVEKNHSCKHKNLNQVILNQGSNGSLPLIQPRTGVAHTSDEIEILTYLRANGLEVSSIQLDASSRKNLYDKAREGVMRTKEGGKSFLNGYPIPVHGVKGVEKILESIDTPFQVRAGSPDHRLVYEIGIAGGASSVEGGFICYLYPYDKRTSPIESLKFWKYVDKLSAWYYRKHNVKVNREYFGPLTCCLIEPVIPICINIVQAILSAKSGVKCISVGYAEQGNRIQDVAAINTLDKMTRWYFEKYGLMDCTLSTVFHQYMAAFPTDINKSRELIRQSSVTAGISKVSRILTKTPVESHHIPTKENNAEGLHLTRVGLMMAKDTKLEWTEVQKEMELLEKEVRVIMGAIENLGSGSLAKGIMKAFDMGILDIPFSPSNYNRNQLLTARDCNGAVRFINPEELPFSPEIVDFHKERVQKRMTRERKTKVSELMEEDVTRIWKNDFLKWPLDGIYVY